jgi:hypothetical protein
MTLYKYTTRDGMKKTLSGASLLMRPVNEYNDPFEAAPAMSSEEVRKAAIMVAKSERSLERYANDPSLNEEALTLPQIKSRVHGDPAFVGEIADRLLRRSETSPKEVVQNFQEFFSRFFGMVCLTRNPANFLMWSLYAEKHCGFVFSIDPTLWNHTRAENVTYSHHRVSLPSVESATNEELVSIFLTKSMDWKHEDEYRILRRVNAWKEDGEGRQAFLELNYGQIKWVCAGVWTPEEDVDELRAIVKASKFPEARVYRASLNSTEFKIDLPPECRGPA